MNRYQNILQTKYNKKRAYQTVRYPEIPLNENDIYVITVQGDRFDLLADQYYKDSSLWWVISIANNFIDQASLMTPEGVQIRIPSGISGILNSFNQINS